MTDFHVPILEGELVDNLITDKSGVYLDLTFGGGGHSRAILNSLNKSGKLIVFDQDSDAILNAERFIDKRIYFFKSNFVYFYHFLEFLKIKQVDGIFADLGVSSYQIDTAERGFSIRFNGNLDMRMNKESKITAHYIINNYSSQKLEKIFKEYGEFDNYKKLVSKIIYSRKEKSIDTTADFVRIVSECVHRSRINKGLAQAFQSIRIEVNNELDSLRFFLEKSPKYLKKGGKLVVISYHSLEDRIVKRFLQNGGSHEEAETDFYGNKLVSMAANPTKVITPSDEEIFINSRASSAKMRVGEKI